MSVSLVHTFSDFTSQAFRDRQTAVNAECTRLFVTQFILDAFWTECGVSGEGATEMPDCQCLHGDSLHSQILLALVNASLQWSAARSREGLAVRAWRSQDECHGQAARWPAGSQLRELNKQSRSNRATTFT